MITIKEEYDSWYLRTQPKDAPAVQTIECRRAFYSGCTAMFHIINENCSKAPAKEAPAHLEKLLQELEAFFNAETETGFGIPPEGN